MVAKKIIKLMLEIRNESYSHQTVQNLMILYIASTKNKKIQRRNASMVVNLKIDTKIIK